MRLFPSIVTLSWVRNLLSVKLIIVTAGPQLNVIMPPPLLAVARAASKAASVQLAGEPLPTTAFAAEAFCADAARDAAARSSIQKKCSACFVMVLKIPPGIWSITG